MGPKLLTNLFTIFTLCLTTVGCQQGDFRIQSNPLGSQALSSASDKDSEPQNDPVPASPPPVTLGSYPWIIVENVHYSNSGDTAIVRGITYDENWDEEDGDPIGIPFESGYLAERNGKSSIKLPITIESKSHGRLSFTIPASWVQQKDLVVVLTGPGFKSVPFRVCDLDNF